MNGKDIFILIVILLIIIAMVTAVISFIKCLPLFYVILKVVMKNGI